MKYVDKNITVEAAKINFFDTDRPGPALTRMFNPPKNILRALNIFFGGLNIRVSAGPGRSVSKKFIFAASTVIFLSTYFM